MKHNWILHPRENEIMPSFSGTINSSVSLETLNPQISDTGSPASKSLIPPGGNRGGPRSLLPPRNELSGSKAIHPLLIGGRLNEQLFSSFGVRVNESVRSSRLGGETRDSESDEPDSVDSEPNVFASSDELLPSPTSSHLPTPDVPDSNCQPLNIEKSIMVAPIEPKPLSPRGCEEFREAKDCDLAEDNLRPKGFEIDEFTQSLPKEASSLFSEMRPVEDRPESSTVSATSFIAQQISDNVKTSPPELEPSQMLWDFRDLSSDGKGESHLPKILTPPSSFSLNESARSSEKSSDLKKQIEPQNRGLLPYADSLFKTAMSPLTYQLSSTVSLENPQFEVPHLARAESNPPSFTGEPFIQPPGLSFIAAPHLNLIEELPNISQDSSLKSSSEKDSDPSSFLSMERIAGLIDQNCPFESQSPTFANPSKFQIASDSQKSRSQRWRSPDETLVVLNFPSNRGTQPPKKNSDQPKPNFKKKLTIHFSPVKNLTKTDHLLPKQHQINSCTSIPNKHLLTPPTFKQTHLLPPQMISKKPVLPSRYASVKPRLYPPTSPSVSMRMNEYSSKKPSSSNDRLKYWALRKNRNSNQHFEFPSETESEYSHLLLNRQQNSIKENKKAPLNCPTIAMRLRVKSSWSKINSHKEKSPSWEKHLKKIDDMIAEVEGRTNKDFVF